MAVNVIPPTVPPTVERKVTLMSQMFTHPCHVKSGKNNSRPLAVNPFSLKNPGSLHIVRKKANGAGSHESPQRPAAAAREIASLSKGLASPLPFRNTGPKGEK